MPFGDHVGVAAKRGRYESDAAALGLGANLGGGSAETVEVSTTMLGAGCAFSSRLGPNITARRSGEDVIDVNTMSHRPRSRTVSLRVAPSSINGAVLVAVRFQTVNLAPIGDQACGHRTAHPARN
jgi:hypothetical protein